MHHNIQVVGAAITRSDEILVAQRGPEMSLPGEWEFPGGKVELGESPQDALAREVLEELGVEVSVGESIGRSTLTTAAGVIVLDVYWCTIVAGTPEPREHAEVRWVRRDELVLLEWAAADIPIVALICEHG